MRPDPYRLDDEPIEEPTPTELAARERGRKRPLGSLLRVRSWLTVLLGLLCLAVLALMFGLTY